MKHTAKVLITAGAILLGAIPAQAAEAEISQGMFAWLTVEAYNSACSINGGTENLWENEIEGMTAEDWILAEAKNSAKEYLAVEEEFAQSGLSLRASEEETIDETLERYWNELGYGRYYEDFGIGEDDFRDVLTHSTKISILYDEKKAELEEAITQEELTSYIQEHTTLLEYISVPNTEELDEDATEEEKAAWTDADAIYNGYRDRLEKGESLADLVEEVGANEELQTLGVGSSWQYELPDVLFWNDSSQLSEEFRAAMAEAEPGTIYYFDDAAQSYQIIFMTEEFSPDWEGLDYYRDSIVSAMTDQAFLDEMSSWGEEMELANEADLPTAQEIRAMWNEE